jgi:hypothetical protein
MWRIIFVLSLPVLALGMVGHSRAETYTVDGAVKPAASLPPPPQAPRADAKARSKEGKRVDPPAPLASNVAVDPSTGRVIGSTFGSMGGDTSGPMGAGSENYATAPPPGARTGRQLAPMIGADPDEALKKR